MGDWAIRWYQRRNWDVLFNRQIAFRRNGTNCWSDSRGQTACLDNQSLSEWQRETIDCSIVRVLGWSKEQRDSGEDWKNNRIKEGLSETSVTITLRGNHCKKRTLSLKLREEIGQFISHGWYLRTRHWISRSNVILLEVSAMHACLTWVLIKIKFICQSLHTFKSLQQTKAVFPAFLHN